MSRKAQNRNNENAGMTLVELLVAITILGIIVVPLLHTFVSSSRVSLKTRRQLRVTTAAQDIMEGLKAESIESLSCSFNYPDDDLLADPSVAPVVNSFANFDIIRPELVDGGNSSRLYELRATIDENEASPTYRSVSGLTNISAATNASMDLFGDADPANADKAATTKASDDGVNYDFYGKSDRKYYFAIQNMNIENDAGDPVYVVDALIEVDGSNYTSLGSDQKTTPSYSTEEGSALLNENGMISYSAMDSKRDAFFIQDVMAEIKAAQEFNTTYSPAVDCTADDLAQRIVIETVNQTKLAPSQTAADGKDWITITCEVTYTANKNNPNFLIPVSHADYDVAKGGDQPFTKTEKYTIFDNKSTGYMPENLYICYYPGYNNWALDDLIYVNADSVPTTLHLIKQEPKNNGTLNHDEISYKCNVTVNEGAGAAADHIGIGDRASSVTDIRTNLDTNLYTAYLKSVPSTKQAVYKYNGATLSRDKANPETARIYELGGEEEAVDRMFDVTIDIYEEGTLATALGASGVGGTGTIDNSRILFTLEGSMN